MTSYRSPWLALACDWQDDPMFNDASHGVRLAWVSLLCHVKSQGRGGRARFNPVTFARRYDLDPRAINGMIERAVSHGSLIVDGDDVQVPNWDKWQGKGGQNRGNRRKPRKVPPTKQASRTREDPDSALCVPRSSEKPESLHHRVVACLRRMQTAETPEDALRVLGVTGDLARRAGRLAGLTVDEMRAEMESIADEPDYPALVMCKRLFDKRGLEMKNGASIGQDTLILSSELQEIEDKRRRMNS